MCSNSSVLKIPILYTIMTLNTTWCQASLSETESVQAGCVLEE